MPVNYGKREPRETGRYFEQNYQSDERLAAISNRAEHQIKIIQR